MDRHSSYIFIWLQLELCAMAVLLTKGEIRCYCDAAHCVATGYMCKSELSACFSRLLDPQNANSPLTHGCLDSLGSTVDICPTRRAQNHSGTAMPTLECCHEDMCNYRGLHDVLAPPKGETSGQGNKYQRDGSRHLITKVQELTSSKELWFRAAVIAVPIAGGLILVLLIMLALRMLRSENKRLQDQRQQMLSRLHYSFHGYHSKKGQVAKLDLECMVPSIHHINTSSGKKKKSGYFFWLQIFIPILGKRTSLLGVKKDLPGLKHQLVEILPGASSILGLFPSPLPVAKILGGLLRDTPDISPPAFWPAAWSSFLTNLEASSLAHPAAGRRGRVCVDAVGQPATSGEKKDKIMEFMLFLEAVEPVVVDSRGFGSFPLCGNNLFFLRRLRGAFLGLNGAADAA
ncbi:Bmp And Activin Membrane-Bound Inhibitor-like [Manis pentadactyla]|nr:Bmp And Activin Membrane-Bound Inhibitor-like [Manis pentadactyla]